jgi:integrase
MHATLTEQGVSASEQFKAATTLRAALADAVRQGLILHNPATRVKKPKVQHREMRPMDTGEAKALLAAVRDDRLRCLYDLGLDAGARPGELFALHWSDVLWSASEVFIHRGLEEIDGRHRLKPTKTEAGRRRVRLAVRTLASLQEHRERMRAEGRDVETAPVFVDTQGGFLRRSNFLRNSFAPALKRAGLAGKGIRPYDLRHTSATLLLLAGVNVKVVSQRLGHESIEITLKHYAHCLPAMQEAAAAAVDRLFSEERPTDKADCPTVVPQGPRAALRREVQTKTA